MTNVPVFIYGFPEHAYAKQKGCSKSRTLRLKGEPKCSKMWVLVPSRKIALIHEFQ